MFSSSAELMTLSSMIVSFAKFLRKKNIVSMFLCDSISCSETNSSNGNIYYFDVKRMPHGKNSMFNSNKLSHRGSK